MTVTPSPIKEEDVQQNPDMHINQDFPGFPHLPAHSKNFTPKTAKEKKAAIVKTETFSEDLWRVILLQVFCTPSNGMSPADGKQN